MKNKSDTYWAGPEENVEDLEFTLSVAKAEVKKPTADATPFVFDNTDKTYVFGSTDDSALYATSGAMTKKSSGSTSLTVSLLDAEDYRWEEGDSEPLVFPFAIAKRAIAAPDADETAYVYDGTLKTYTFKKAEDKAWFTAQNLTRTDAGSQNVVVALEFKNDSYWAGSDPQSSEELNYLFSIAKAEVTAPTATALSYVYTGGEQTYVFAAAGDETLYSVGARTMTLAGSMNVSVSLIYPLNYRWKGTESSDALSYTFTIAPAKVTKPAPDTTKFYCNGNVQTYSVAPSPFYIVSGTSKSAYGTTNVVISLNDTDNYVWDNAPEADSSEDLLYPFTIEHDFKNKYSREEFKASDADCTHKATYYFVCDCGEVGSDTYEVGEPLGHIYTVVFDWGTPETVDGVDSYSEVYVDVSCERCDHVDRLLTDLTVDVTLPGKAKGLKKYTATIVLDHRYTDTREVVLPAIYHNYGDPTWDWSVGEDGYPVVVATFPCIDEGAEHLSISVPAEVTVADKDESSFEYVATAYLYEKPHENRSVRAKPSLTFISGEGDDKVIVSTLVLPGQDVTALIPSVPTREDALFLKWWDAENGLSLVYGDTGYTPFVMRDKDRIFVALWKNIGQINVTVSDVEGQNFSGCVVELKQGDSTVGTLTTDETGVVSFDELEYGNYSIVVTDTDGTTVTYTTGTVLGEAEKTVPVKMSEKRFNTEVNDESGKNVSVENLENTVPEEDKEQIVTSGQEGDIAEITVVLSVVNETDPAVVADMTEQIEAQDNKVIDLSDITLVKTVKVIDQNGDEVSSDSTLVSSEELVDITFPITEDIYAALAAVHGSVENVVVARKDGSAVKFMTKYTEEVAMSSEEECFYVTEEDGVPYVVVRAKTFSTTYGLCVNGGSVGADNKIVTFEYGDWTYGETPIPVTATSTYGTPVIYYQVNGEWVTELPNDAGTYNIKAVVEETSAYKGAEAGAQITVSKARYDTSKIRFEDLTVLYDGEVHSILVEGLPEGVTVNYENNGQVDVGEYLITVYFVGDVNYEAIPAMTATLRIVEEEEGGCCILFWILLAIAILEVAILIFLIIRGKKYKKKYNEEKEKSMFAMMLLGISRAACLAINIILAVVDLALLALIVWNTLLNRKYKKMYEELLEENKTSEKSSEENESAEPSDGENETLAEEAAETPADEAGEAPAKDAAETPVEGAADPSENTDGTDPE